MTARGDAPVLAGSLDVEVDGLLRGSGRPRPAVLGCRWTRQRADVRAGDRPLAPNRLMREVATDKSRQLVERELPNMKRVVLTCRVAVQPTVGRGHHQHSVVRKDPRDLGEHLLVFGDVLDDLEGHDGAERSGLELREIRRAAEAERQPRACVVEPAVLDRPFVDIDPDDLRGSVGQDRGSESLAAADVEYSSTSDDLRRPHVAMKMLVDHLNIGSPGNTALPSPFDQARRARPALSGQQPLLPWSRCAFMARMLPETRYTLSPFDIFRFIRLRLLACGAGAHQDTFTQDHPEPIASVSV